MMPRVRCKFKIDRISRFLQSTPGPDGTCETWDVEASPVCRSGENTENTAFWRYTPSGSLKFSTVNGSAAKALELGKEYYLDLTPAF